MTPTDAPERSTTVKTGIVASEAGPPDGALGYEGGLDRWSLIWVISRNAHHEHISSAIHQKAGMAGTWRLVSFVPTGDIPTSSIADPQRPSNQTGWFHRRMSAKRVVALLLTRPRLLRM
jgi:hypothetical protein